MSNHLSEADFFEYRDSVLSLRVPSYLKQKKGIRCFARSSGKKNLGLMTLAIELTDQPGSEVYRSVLTKLKPVDQWKGVQTDVIRQGPTNDLQNGAEQLASSTNTVNGDVFHFYNVLFSIGNRYIYVTFGGSGSVEEFESLCRGILLSILVIS